MQCNFAKTAIRELVHEHKAYGKMLNGKTLHNVSEAFNKHFEGYPAMQESVIEASETFLKIAKIFNKRSHTRGINGNIF